MISTAPVAATSPILQIGDKVRAFIATAKVAAAGGLTWREFGELLVALLRVLIESLDTVSGMTGPEKKAAVVEAAGMLFDALADKAVPLTLWPVWILVRPAVRSLVLALASGAVEPILQLVRA
jgi:hypothetical protein